MASASRLYRVGAALAALGMLVATFGLVVAIANTAFSLPPAGALANACSQLLPTGATVVALPIITLATLGVAVLVRAVRSIWTRARAERRFRAALRWCARLDLGGTPVTVVDHADPRAFCAGYVRPRIYLSRGALARLSKAELQAVVAHECHHLRRHDPLRLLVAGVLADALFFLPALRRLGGRYGALAEVAADEAAARVAGTSTLASALLAFGGSHSSEMVVGIAPERVDHLLGERPRWELPASLFVGAVVTLGGLLTATVGVLWLVGTRVDIALFLARSCMVLMCTLGVIAAAAGGLLLSGRRAERRYAR